MIEVLKRQTAFAAYLVSNHLKPGDSAIDATVGTGADTALLAQCVGNSGKVYAFDVQQQAIDQAQKRIRALNLGTSTRFYCQGHETMDLIPEIQSDEKIKAVMFNLGYLPGADHALTTLVETTMTGIQKALALMTQDGLMTICAYTHSEGQKEIRAIEAFARKVEKGIAIYKIEPISHANSPILYVVHKK